MPLQFFSPNTSNTGAALFVSFDSKGEAVYFKLLKQTGWNAETQKGSFQGGEYINVKFSLDEVGAFIYAVRSKSAANFYHSFGDDTTTGSLTHYQIAPKTPQQKPKEGFGLKIKRGESEFKVGFSLGAAERLMEYLRFALDHVFSAIYSADKKQAEEYLKKKPAPTKAKTTPAPEPEQKSPEEETGEIVPDPEDF